MIIGGQVDKVVTTALYGGLGNQLFQYAAARALAARRKVPLVLDLSWFDNIPASDAVTPRKYALSPFALNAQVQSTGFYTQSQHFLKKVFRRVLRQFGLANQGGVYFERSFAFDPQVLELSAPVCLHGHWQSPKYFSDAQEIIRAEIGSVGAMSEKSRALHAEISAADAICLHVRRGDYVTNKNAAQFHGLCSMDYYRQGVQIAAADLRNPHGYVFSDDPEWVRQNLDVGLDFTVVDVNGLDDAHQDLWLMAACKNFVIANSSLSWWGAWLGACPQKRVVAPLAWFNDAQRNTSDLIPGEWVRLA